ncbi:MAG: hypothetical protein J6Q55_03530 [Clostridia bacterium]|nr:hypothetical protein [Clostridia bacterium]
MKSKHRQIVNEVIATLQTEQDCLSRSEIAYSIEQLREVLQDLLYFYQDGDQTVACIENCIYYLEEMLTIDSTDDDFVINQSVVLYELLKLC